MKKALLILAAVVASATAFAQGTITLANANMATGLAQGGVYRVDILQPDATTGAGANFTAGLFLQGSTTPLATIGFRTTTSQGVFANLSTDVTVPGIQPGSTANLQLKAWEIAAGSWEAATIKTPAGAGLFTSQPLGGPNPVPGQPAFTSPTLTGLQGFPTPGTIAPGAQLSIVMVPEPGTIALGVLGVGSLLLMRRRK